MDITTNDRGGIILSKIYNSICLSADKEIIHICERDGGFELKFNGNTYSIKDKKIKKISDLKENSLLAQLKLYYNYKIDQKEKIISFIKIEEDSKPILEKLKRDFKYILQQELIF